MRIKRVGGYISIRDRAAPFWFLGLFLLAGGILAIAMTLGLATNAGELKPWERLATLGTGLGVGTGALWWLARSPGTHVHLDLAHRRMRLVRTGLFGRRVHRLAFEDLASVQVEESTDSEGGAVWRPVVHLRTGQPVRLSELWSHDRGIVEEVVASVGEACRLPWTRLSEVTARGASSGR